MSGRAPKWLRFVAVLAMVALVAAGCGDDDDDGGSGSQGTQSEKPVSGGESTLLMYSEVGTLDPVSSTGSGGADAQRMFPIYGALVTFEAEANRAIPYFVDSLQMKEGDPTAWTLKLEEGIKFSDGTTFDAAAVKVNWERVQNPANRSPAISFAGAIKSMTVGTDPLALEIALAAPNAHFDKGVSRAGAMNFIASPAAIAAKADLVNKPVGAGPFVMKEWVRDSHMVLERNPAALRKPYLDKVTLRTVGDEQQRLDTFVSGAADAFYTSTPSSVTKAEDQGAAGFASVTVGTGQTFVFNLSKAPFSDARVRKAFVVGIDRKALDEVVFGPGAVPASTFAREDSPWFTEDADIPEYDKEEAQRLFTEAAADLGGTVTINLQGFQQSLDQRRVEFVQTSLNQYRGVKVNVKINDSPTSIGNVLQGNYEVSSWGFPYLDPEPDIYNALRTGLRTNVAKYSNPEVDKALDEARASTDNEERAELYATVLAAAARDLPFFPYVDTTNGFVYSEKLKGAKVWQDGILRFDLLWLDQG